MRRLLFTAAVFPIVATAQVDVVDVPSIWAPWTADIKTECTATLLGANGQAIARQTAKLGNVLFRQPLFQATYDGLPSEPMEVMGIQLFCKQEGANFDGEGGWRVRRATPFVVPAGKRLSVAYSPGLTKGQVAFAIGETVPSAVLQQTLSGTQSNSVPPDKFTIDATGIRWSLGETAAAGLGIYGVQVLRNGQYRAPWHATVIVNRGGRIYFKNAVDQWYAVRPDGGDAERSGPPPQ